MIRIRKSEGGIPGFTLPEIIPTDPEPKPGSPLATISWLAPNNDSVGYTIRRSSIEDCPSIRNFHVKNLTHWHCVL